MIAISAGLGVPVKLVGVGEGIDDLIDFDRAAFLEAILPPVHENAENDEEQTEEDEMQRPDGRTKGAMRPVKITTDYTMYAEGSVLVEMGNTKVICTASVEEKVPPFLEGKGLGWVTAEYAMLPRATNTRKKRDIKSLKLDGRSSEIQRLIGRALRAVVDREALGERQITIDCDVIQADGGTRCASITGGFVALWLACKKLLADGVIEKMPLTAQVAAVSVGIFEDEAVLDLNYAEDSHAIVDCKRAHDEQG